MNILIFFLNHLTLNNPFKNLNILLIHTCMTPIENNGFLIEKAVLIKFLKIIGVYQCWYSFNV